MCSVSRGSRFQFNVSPEIKMVKSLVCFAVLSLIVQVAVTHENEIKPNERKEGQDQRLSVVVHIRETVKGTLQTRGNKVTVSVRKLKVSTGRRGVLIF